MRWLLHISILLFIVFTGVNGQLFASDILLKTGIAELEGGKFEQAAETFQSVLEDIGLAAIHADARYWLVKTEILLKRYDVAMKHVDNFFALHPDSSHILEMKYQQARLFFFRGHPEKALIVLGRFIIDYSGSPLVPSARYWVGESLMALGRLKEADVVFNDLIRTYPQSVKYEAARYRINEIAFYYRERKLLELLQWSHEKYLGYAEDLQRQRIEYYETLKAVDKRAMEKVQEDEELQYIKRLLKARARLLDMKEFYGNTTPGGLK